MTDGLNNETQEGSTGDSGESTPTWYIDEGIAGAGERPAWLPAKFKTVKGMADSYSELEKRFTSPSEDYDLSKGDAWFNKDFDPLKNMLNEAKKSKVPQAAIDSMLSSVGEYLNDGSFNIDSEIEKLGENHTARIETLSNWAKSNLSEKGFNSVMDMAMSADDIMALEELRGLHMSNENQVPANQNTQPSSKNLKDLQQEVIGNYQKYKTDKGYRDTIKSQMEKLLEQ